MIYKLFLQRIQAKQIHSLKYQSIISRLVAYCDPNALLPVSDDRVDLLMNLEGTDEIAAVKICQLLHATAAEDAHVCEFGVAHGHTSALIANELKLQQRTTILHLFDSFAGLPAPTEKDKLLDDIFMLGSIENYQGSMSVSRASVESKMLKLGFSSYVVHEGYISESTVVPERISFAYVDLDFYAPIRCALSLIWPSLIPGGVIMIDDYGFFSSGAKIAVDEFAAEHWNARLSVSARGVGPYALLTKS